LQRESTFAQFADDRDFCQVVERIDTFVAVTGRNYNPTLVPPLQLPEADAGEFCYSA